MCVPLRCLLDILQLNIVLVYIMELFAIFLSLKYCLWMKKQPSDGLPRRQGLEQCSWKRRGVCFHIKVTIAKSTKMNPE